MSALIWKNKGVCTYGLTEKLPKLQGKNCRNWYVEYFDISMRKTPVTCFVNILLGDVSDIMKTMFQWLLWLLDQAQEGPVTDKHKK